MDSGMDLGFKLKLIYDCIQKHANSDLTEVDLTFSQHRTIMYLAHKEGHMAELKELEREFRVSQPTVAGIAQRLEIKGYVEAMAHPTDRRVKLIRLTPLGLGLEEKSRRKMVRRNREMVEGLSPQELEELERLLDRVYQNMLRSD